MRTCAYEKCNKSLEGRDVKAKYCCPKCKNNHNYHTKDKREPKVVKSISPEFLSRGTIRYAGITM